MIRRVFFIVLVSILTSFSIVFAQEVTPNQKVAELLKTKNYYELNNYYPTVKEKVSPLLQLLTEARTGSRFNRYEESCKAIEKLLNEHTDELDPNEISDLFSLLTSNLAALGGYEQAIEFLNYAYPTDSPNKSSTIKYWQALASVPPLEIIAPNRDVILPFTFEKKGRGEHLSVEAEMNGIKDKYIFDTGCNDFNFVSEEFAHKHNLKIILDSLITMGGTGATSICKLALGGDMKLGDITIKYPLFIILPEGSFPDSVEIDAILGTGILKKLKEVQIIPAKNQIIIPYEQSSISTNKQNLMLDGCYYLFLSVNGKPSYMLFDTGNGKSFFNINYYNTNKQYIHKEGRKHSGQLGAIAEIAKYDGYIIPNRPFKLGETTINLFDIEVVTIKAIDNSPHNQGSLGIDFIKAFNKITINFEKMFVVGD